MTAALYLGCPIWAHKGWIGSFYPPKMKRSDALREYARRLTAVEGNTTFYAVPSPATLQGWVAETPPTFRFCPKLPRQVSHSGKLVEQIALAQQFIERMRLLGSRLGALFLQLPPRYPPRLLGDLQTFLASFPADLQLAVEVRHPDWFEPPHRQALDDLLRAYGMARVMMDTRPIRSLQGDPLLEGSVYQRMLAARQRKPDVPVFMEHTASFVFMRYIGHPQMEMNLPYIEEWSQRLAEWLAQEISAYVFCHCPVEDLDPWLCRQFHRQVAVRFPIPPLPWDELESGESVQPRLF